MSDSVKTQQKPSSSEETEQNLPSLSRPRARVALPVPDPIIQQPSSPSSSMSDYDSDRSASSSEEMLRIPSVGGGGVGALRIAYHNDPIAIPKPTSQQQQQPANDDQHKTRVVVCGLPAAASDFSASAKRHRHSNAGGGSEDGSRKQYFQRTWSDDDEIAFLRGLSEYVSGTGMVPLYAADFEGFCDFVLESDSFVLVFSKSQLINKVQKLRAKYSKHAAKERGGAGLSFLKNSHERLLYDLSKTIWGGGSACGDSEANKATKNVKVDGVMGVPFVDCLHGNTSVQTDSDCREDFLRQGLHLIGDSPSPIFVERWNDLRKVEMKLFLRRAALIQEQIQLLANI